MDSKHSRSALGLGQGIVLFFIVRLPMEKIALQIPMQTRRMDPNCQRALRRGLELLHATILERDIAPHTNFLMAFRVAWRPLPRVVMRWKFDGKLAK